MKLLCLDTSVDACSVALGCDGEITVEHHIAGRQHTKLLLPSVDKLLAQSGLKLPQLDAIVVANGPGSFTGVRIAASVAQGLAFAADLPIAPVSSLAALAQSSFRQHGSRQTAAAFDARMGELYWGCYAINADDVAESVIVDQVAAADAVDIPSDGQWTVAGEGAGSYAEVLQSRLGNRLLASYPELLASAEDLLPLANTVEWLPAEQVIPVYLRNNVAKVKQQ